MNPMEKAKKELESISTSLLMNKKQFLILFIIGFYFLLIFHSCKKDPYADYPQWILGEWVSLDNFYKIQMDGFNFTSNDSCEIRPGYREITLFPRPKKYYGNTTAYQICNDTFNLFDLEENQWKTYKIRFPSPDTMAVTYPQNSDTDFTITYIRSIYPTHRENLFDQVIVIASYSAVIKVISIDKHGELFYDGIVNNLYDGLYTSKGGKKAFKQIELLFQEANFRNEYVDFSQMRAKRELEEGEPVTFIKNNKMITVAGPFYEIDDGLEETSNYSKELEWAFEQVSFLEQQMPVVPLDSSEYKNSPAVLTVNGFPYFYFVRKDNKKKHLAFTESFYLWTCMLHAQKVDIDFTPVYKMHLLASNTCFQSDGRYYRYKTKKGEAITFDLGFNFIEENNLTDTFK
jgi:hypothetical protein